MTPDPLDPSAEWQARMDQMRASARELADTLDAMLTELTAHGWSETQAREIIVAGLRSQQR